MTESVEMALSLSAGGPLPRLTLLEAESDSLVQLQLKICSFCGGSDRRQLGRGDTYEFHNGRAEFCACVFEDEQGRVWVGRQK